VKAEHAGFFVVLYWGKFCPDGYLIFGRIAKRRQSAKRQGVATPGFLLGKSQTLWAYSSNESPERRQAACNSLSSMGVQPPGRPGWYSGPHGSRTRSEPAFGSRCLAPRRLAVTFASSARGHLGCSPSTALACPMRQGWIPASPVSRVFSLLHASHPQD